MRFIHTADWHLGRILFGVHLTEDQAGVLDQVVDILKDSGARMLVVAGDVYDRAVPPPDAVRLLDDFLSRVVSGLNMKVLLIAGNHDSPDRMGFASSILEAQGLFMRGAVGNMSPAVVEDEHGPVDVFAVPYAEPPTVREILGDESVKDHETAMKALLSRSGVSPRKNRRSVLAAHAFVAGGGESESERPLAVGGSAAVPHTVFDGYGYVALGHLHRPQTAGAAHIRYSGSLFPYSFSEAGQDKTLNLVEMDRNGQCHVTPVSLSFKRNLRIVKGFMDEVLRLPPSGDYIQVNLLDKTPVLDALGRLRAVFPNLLHIERPHLAWDGRAENAGTDHRKTNHNDLFQCFYKDMTGEDIQPGMARAYMKITESSMRKQREVLP